MFVIQPLLRCIIGVLLLVLVTSCWRRQCPIRGCKVKYEHQHSGRIVRGRGTWPRIYFFGMNKEKKTASKAKPKG